MAALVTHGQNLPSRLLLCDGERPSENDHAKSRRRTAI
jgi:hypothetical protein